MDIKMIKKLGEIMNSEGLKVLELSDGSFSVKIERDIGISILPPEKLEALGQTRTSMPQRILLPRMKRVSVQRDPKPKQVEGPKVFEIRSPLIGKFFAKPSDNANPYVIIGKRVRTGDVLCMIEVGKEISEITSEIDGEITEVLVKHNDTLAFDQIMFKIKEI